MIAPPSQRPGVDAGWRVLFAFQCPWPRATQAGRWTASLVQTAYRLLLISAIFVLPGCSNHRADYTRRQSSVCELHHIHMTKTNVPIVYGLVRLTVGDKALEATTTNNFPHAKEVVLGGCIVDTPTQAVIYICRDCQAVRRQWEAEHKSLLCVPPDFVADEWIGFTTSSGDNLWKLVLRPDRTGVLTEVYSVTTSEDTLHFEISQWDTAPSAVTCAFRQGDVNDPLKMRCSVDGDRLDATLQNGEGGWKENILFWRARKLNDKLRTLGK